MSSWYKYVSSFFKNLWKLSFLLALLSIAIGIFLFYGILQSLLSDKQTERLSSHSSVLVLNLDGVIMRSNKFLKTLRDYIDKDNIKAVVIRVNSPGGAVGPSQAIYRELVKVREKFKKPVIMSLEAIATSGAYYISAGADQIVTQAGTLMGSIGVIINFANLEELYKWAKIERYALKTGKYKDVGADYRSMSTEEKNYLQGVLDEVLKQFKDDVVKGRKLDPDLVDQNADGRIFTGEKAVELGFADKIGNFSDAIELAEELTGEESLKIFNPREKPTFLRWFDDMESIFLKNHIFSFLFYPQTPMYLMPSF